MKIVCYFVAAVFTLQVDSVVCMRNIALAYQNQVEAQKYAIEAMKKGLGDGAALFVRADIFADTDERYDTYPEVMDERNLACLKKATSKGNHEALQLVGIINLNAFVHSPNVIIKSLYNVRLSMSEQNYPFTAFDDFSLLGNKCAMFLLSNTSKREFIAMAYEWLRKAAEAGNQRACKNLSFYFVEGNYFDEVFPRDQLANLYNLGQLHNFYALL
jgi:TPR repeat protein